jgi:hypothetical protein
MRRIMIAHPGFRTLDTCSGAVPLEELCTAVTCSVQAVLECGAWTRLKWAAATLLYVGKGASRIVQQSFLSLLEQRMWWAGASLKATTCWGTRSKKHQRREAYRHRHRNCSAQGGKLIVGWLPLATGAFGATRLADFAA